MARLGILNMIIGFVFIFLASSAGPMIAAGMTQAFLHDPEQLVGWQLTLQSSSHGHTNLFGMLHVLFGLTLPYSGLSAKIKTWQTAGLAFGGLAMGPLMIVRSMLGPTSELDLTEVAIGTGLSLALIAVAIHILGLCLKLRSI